MIVDRHTGRLVTEINGLTRARGIAFDSEGKIGYVTHGGAGTAIVFDRKTIHQRKS